MEARALLPLQTTATRSDQNIKPDWDAKKKKKKDESTIKHSEIVYLRQHEKISLGFSPVRRCTHHDSSIASRRQILQGSSHGEVSDASSRETGSWPPSPPKAKSAAAGNEGSGVSVKPEKPQRSSRCSAAPPAHTHISLGYKAKGARSLHSQLHGAPLIWIP